MNPDCPKCGNCMALDDTGLHFCQNCGGSNMIENPLHEQKIGDLTTYHEKETGDDFVHLGHLKEWAKAIINENERKINTCKCMCFEILYDADKEMMRLNPLAFCQEICNDCMQRIIINQFLKESI